jgi:hypothetical protein
VNARDLEEAESIMRELAPHYLMVRMLADGSVAGLQRLAYTTAICLGMNRTGWSDRFCFEDRELATQRFGELQSEDDVPEGFIAQRRGTVT